MIPLRRQLLAPVNISGVAAGNPRYYAQASDPGGENGNLWMNTDTGILSIRIAAVWQALFYGGTSNGTAGNVAPANNYFAPGGQAGGTASLADAIVAGTWQVRNGILTSS